MHGVAVESIAWREKGGTIWKLSGLENKNTHQHVETVCFIMCFKVALLDAYFKSCLD